MKIIMIVDDERVLREAFAAYFSDRHWQPIIKGSGEEGLQLLEKESPNAALVDIRLPGMDGGEFIRRACQLKPQMAFVICTGSPEYHLPPDLQQNPQVSNHIFRKPVARLVDLENELTRMIQILEQNHE